jgi:ribosomal-protein-alanine N-acetyltransferase
MRYINTKLHQSTEESAAFIEKLNNVHSKNEGITWGISLKGESKIIGTILIMNIDTTNHRAEVGYLLSPAYWRKGIVNEALRTVLNYGFNTLQLHSIEANVNPENNASIGLLEKNNFIKEAYFKENFFYEGVFLDSAVYSLLRANYK